MKKICVIGNFSGRNAGDAAILECLLRDVYSLNRQVEFLIPTINRSFIEETYHEFPVKPYPLMPWNLSLKILGWPTFQAVLKSDLVLLTDAILFDRSLWNPIFNYLSTMAIVLPMAAGKGIPVIPYNVSLGPIRTKAGKYCLQRVLDSCELVIVRDRESIDILDGTGITKENIIVSADCALNTPLPTEERMEEIKRKEGLLQAEERYISFNVNAYLDVFMKGKSRGITAGRFTQTIGATIDRVIEELGVGVILVVTQVMDTKISEQVLERVKNRHRVTMITNKNYSHNDIAGILSKMELHVGMRTHSIILATSTCTPTIALVYRPKNRGYMRMIEQPERMVEFGDGFTTQRLFRLILETWDSRQAIREQLRPIIDREKEKARNSAGYLAKYLSDPLPPDAISSLSAGFH